MMSRSLDTPPWEQPDRSLDGRDGFSDSASIRATFVSRAPRYEARTPRRATEVESGLTRRGVVYEYIRAHPGAHVRGMARELHIGTGDLQYHLFWLQKNGFVKTRKSGFYRFVYPTMMFREEQEILLGVLSQETPREILLCLLEDQTVTQGVLARRLEHSQPTISWHMDRLVQLGVVSKKRTSGGVVYQVVSDREDVLSFVKSYYPEVWKRWAGRLAGLAVSAGAKRFERDGSARGLGLMPTAVVELIGRS